jgi:hypothetical protein
VRRSSRAPHHERLNSAKLRRIDDGANPARPAQRSALRPARTTTSSTVSGSTFAKTLDQLRPLRQARLEYSRRTNTSRPDWPGTCNGRSPPPPEQIYWLDQV